MLKKSFYLITCVFVLLLCSFHQKNNGYKTVVIGAKTWMAENLRELNFRNGDAIVQAHSKPEWDSLNQNKVPAYCYYNFDKANGKIYGLLYNFYAVKNERSLAPKGWHVATYQDWMNLYDVLGFKEEGTQLKSTAYWKAGGNGTNSSGFNALPGGSAEIHQGEYSYWWTATQDTNYIEGTYIFFLGYDMSYLDWRTFSWDAALSVRCVKDSR